MLLTLVHDLIRGLDPDHDGNLSLDEFLRVMGGMEAYLVEGEALLQEAQSRFKSPTSQFPKSQKSVMSALSSQNSALLPKTGVYFLPAAQVLQYLAILNELRRKSEKDGDYQMANRLKITFELFSNQELERQKANMRLAQEKELQAVDDTQSQQFQEFASAWDTFMKDYEGEAFRNIEQLKERHLLENEELREKVSREFQVKQKLSRELMEARKLEKTHFLLRDYETAEKIKKQADRQEAVERQALNKQREEAVRKQEGLLRKKHHNQLQTLLKRIQRDKQEQVVHREKDSLRLI